jgi:hypothetical protein
MSNQTPPARSNMQTIRAAMGRGPMRPGRIEKAGNPHRALSRLVQYLSPYKLRWRWFWSLCSFIFRSACSNPI